MPRLPMPMAVARRKGYDDTAIDRFCADVLIKSGRADDPYRRNGLTAATGPTYLAVYRETVKRYPERDRRQVLLDLIVTRGERGKWFAAAKDAGFLDVALVCARDYAAEPATLVRAARDFAAKEPKFAAEIGLLALERLLNGGGYDPEVSLVQEAFGHLMGAASRIGAGRGTGPGSRRSGSLTAPLLRTAGICNASWPNPWRVGARSRLGVYLEAEVSRSFMGRLEKDPCGSLEHFFALGEDELATSSKGGSR
jgi:hypothetical protein